LNASRTSQTPYGVAYEIDGANYDAERKNRAFLLNLAD
jgi:hypothetical protein